MTASRHYSIRAFFRQMPNTLLARYFSARCALAGFDFSGMKETRIDPLFDAWSALSDKDKARMESELREVWDMSSPAGFQAVLDEAEFHLNDEEQLATFKEYLMALPSHYERAMTVYLDHPELWLGAMRFQHADSLTHWRKRKNLPKVKAATEPADIEALAEAISSSARQLHRELRCERLQNGACLEFCVKQPLQGKRPAAPYWLTRRAEVEVLRAAATTNRSGC